MITGAQYGGGSDLFYSQFELHAREQKVNQIVLLEVISLFLLIVNEVLFAFEIVRL